MSLWRQLSRGLASLANRAGRRVDTADEVEHYLEQATEAHMARGMSPDAARRAARLELGSVAGVTQQMREYGWENVPLALGVDIRYAARRLRTEPGFTAITVLVLALGIGASTAIMSAVGPILFRSLPYPDADRVMTIWDVGNDGARLELTYNSFVELRERSSSFEALAVYLPWQPTLTGPHDPDRLEGQRVTWEYFRALGVRPALGVDFVAMDDQPGAPGPLILSDALWRERFDADPAIVGRAVTLGDGVHMVVGVMPPAFENVLAPNTEIWTPLQYESGEDRAWGHHLRMIGRLKSGVGAEAAARELAMVAANPIAEFPRVAWASLDGGLVVSTLQSDITRGVRPALLAILGAVGLLLVIACVNVANLIVARGVRRQGEFVLRSMLGAGAGRLTRQAITECLFLAVLGGAAGVGLAVVGVRALIALSPPGLPRAEAIALDGSALTFAVSLTLFVGLALGLVAARVAGGGASSGGELRASRGATARHGRVRGALIVAQVAMALVLLVCSGLLLRSMQQLLEVEPGFGAEGLLTMQVQLSGGEYADVDAVNRYFTQVVESVGRIPGVTSAAVTSQLPLSGDFELYGTHLQPHVREVVGEDRGVFRYSVSAGYFETMRIPLIRGRQLSGEDRAGAAPAAVVSESFVRRRLGDVEAVGHRVVIGGSDPYTIVGVVGDVRQVSLALDDTDAIYVTGEQWFGADRVMSLVVRTRVDAVGLVEQVRQAVWSVDRNQPVVRVASMERLVADSAAERRFAMIVFQVFALVALVLAAAGLYGVMAGSVGERTREIGVRSALGAGPRSILGLVIRQGMRLVAIGVVVGLAAAAAVTRGLHSMLFGISALDPATYVGVVAVLAAVSALACAGPAWRALRVHPATTLRAE